MVNFGKKCLFNSIRNNLIQLEFENKEGEIEMLGNLAGPTNSFCWFWFGDFGDSISSAHSRLRPFGHFCYLVSVAL